MINAFSHYTNTQIKEMVDDWIHSARDREILIYRLIDGMTIEQIVTRYQDEHPDRAVSADTIKRALRKGEAQLIRHVQI